jgi:acyl phosphate:glycerol-3-phosphate acyltransferase
VELGLALRIAASLFAAYLLGAIPWALIVGKTCCRVDVRTQGSGNLGATNVMRVLGWKAALLTLALDIGKGALAVYLAGVIVPAAVYGAAAHEWTMLGATLAAIGGHSYSPYIGFKGGKGVATGAGALLVLLWGTPVWLILLLTFVIVLAVSRIVSLSSVIVAIEFPLLMLRFYPGDWALLALSVVAAGLVIWRHSSNIKRIFRGEEPRMSFTRAPSAQQKGRS